MEIDFSGFKDNILTSFMVKKSIEDKYQTKTDREHVLLRPGTYVGEIELTEAQMWVYTDKMEKKTINYSPGFYKIFDEILVNALDHYRRNPDKVTYIKVNIEDSEISVQNDGPGIEVELHKVENKYVPELIFGHPKSGSNFDDTEDRITGGMNGLGAKLTNIFSKEFKIETIDSERGKKYTQVFKDNLGVINPPKITDNKNKSYTKISFKPDLEKFGLTEITEDHLALFKKRTYDLTAFNLAIHFNGEKLPVKSFQKYIELYSPDAIYEKISDRWEIAVAPSSSFEQVSFVNGISTTRGGKHVDYITDQIVEQLVEIVKKKRKDTVIKPSYVKQNLFVFVRCDIVNPTFNSQTKEELTTPIKKFGSVCAVPEKYVQKLLKTEIMDAIQKTLDFEESKLEKKTDGKKKSRITGYPKLDDAGFAGTKNSHLSILILTEGDSAKAMAVAGISALPDGRDRYGIFPLRGKMLNVRDASKKQIMENEEINAIKQILGVSAGKEYKDIKHLRYGGVMLMTDQDEDGKHIKGLFLNVMDCQFNSLLKFPDYIQDFQTPIVTATKGNVVKDYYSLETFNNEKDKLSGFAIKYKKGLGTNTAQEAKKYFKELDEMIRYFQYDSEAPETMEKIFKKDKANERKDWLSKYEKSLSFKPEEDKKIPVSEFCNKELIHFSNYDNIRSIPRCEDGLKPSHRKIVYCVNKRNWSGELKVAQLAGYVAEHSAYHHGEQSLMQAIIGLAQNFVGSNNLNLLKPNGQFGTRLLGGADAASPRYIFTEPTDYFYDIFHKDDKNLLDYLDDDGTQIEPEYYIPVIPLQLVNGMRGIGTGWSTEIPAYNPFDIIKNIKNLISENEIEPMIPWYRGFKGEIKISDDSKKAIITGKYLLNDKELVITELPVGTWSDKYKEYLESLLESKDISDYRWYCTDTAVKIIVTLSTIPEDLPKKFKLVDTINLTNMHMYDINGRIHKYQDSSEVLQEYYTKRLEYYQRRKEYLLDKYRKDIELASARARFVKDIMDSKLVVFRKSNAEIVKQLKEKKYPELDPGFRYLLSMQISSFTKEKIAELEKSVKDLEELITTLESKSAGEIWTEDLDVLEKKIEDYYAELSSQENAEVVEIKTKSKAKSKSKK